jgi:hypothetical protein
MFRVDRPHSEQMGTPAGVEWLGSPQSPALGALLIPAALWNAAMNASSVGSLPSRLSRSTRDCISCGLKTSLLSDGPDALMPAAFKKVLSLSLNDGFIAHHPVSTLRETAEHGRIPLCILPRCWNWPRKLDSRTGIFGCVYRV